MALLNFRNIEIYKDKDKDGIIQRSFKITKNISKSRLWNLLDSKKKWTLSSMEE